MSSGSFKNFVVCILLFTFFFSLYFSFKKSFYEPDDLKYARMAESGVDKSFNFWLSEHPLWGITGVAIYETSRKLGNTDGAIVPIQFVNSCFGALSVLVFFLAIYILTGNRIVSVFMSLLLGFSFYFWSWSGSVKYYSIAAFFVILTFYFLFRLEKGGSLNAVAAGCLAGISALMHSANLVFLMPAALIILLMKKQVSRNVINIVLFAAGIILFLFIPNILIRHWITGNISETFNFWKGDTAWFGIEEFRGFNYNVHRSTFFAFLMNFRNIMAGYNLSTGRHPVLLFISEYYFIFFLAVTGLFFLFSLVRLFKEKYPYVISLILWIILQFLAMWFVDPYNQYIFVWIIPVLIIFALSLNYFIERFGKIRTVRFFSITLLSVLLIILFSVNLVLSIIPSHKINPFLEKLSYYAGKINRNDVVICTGFYYKSEYFSYFLKVNVIPVTGYYQENLTKKSGEVLARLKVNLDNELSQNKRVFIDKDLLNDAAEIPKWVPPNMNMKDISRFFKRNYVIKPFPDDSTGTFLMLFPRS